MECNQLCYAVQHATGVRLERHLSAATRTTIRFARSTYLVPTKGCRPLGEARLRVRAIIAEFNMGRLWGCALTQRFGYQYAMSR